MLTSKTFAWPTMQIHSDFVGFCGFQFGPGRARVARRSCLAGRVAYRERIARPFGSPSRPEMALLWERVVRLVARCQLVAHLFGQMSPVCCELCNCI